MSAPDWKLGAWPHYESNIEGWQALVKRNAPSADEVAVFAGAHVAMILSRTATGRDGLGLLAAWLSPNLAGYSIKALIRTSMDWQRDANKKRRDTLRRVGHILADVEHELGKRCDVDRAEVAIEASDLRAQLECCSESPTASRPLFEVGYFAWAPSGRAVRALRRALIAFGRAWPWRSQADALNTPRKVETARQAIAHGVKP